MLVLNDCCVAISACAGSDGGRRTPELVPCPRPVSPAGPQRAPSPAGLQRAPSPAGLQRAPSPVDRSGANSPAPLDDRSGANSPAQLDEELEEMAAGYGATVSESRAVFEERRPGEPHALNLLHFIKKKLVES